MSFYSSEDNVSTERSIVRTAKIYEYARVFTPSLFYDLSEYLKMFHEPEPN